MLTPLLDPFGATDSPPRLPDVAPSLVLYDPYPLIRAGLRVTLEGHRGVSICGSCGDAGALLNIIRAERPDIAVVGMVAADIGELDLVVSLKAAVPDLQMLVLAPTDAPAFTRCALQSGARGVLPKHASLGEMAEAIIKLVCGHIVTARDAAERLLQELVRKEGRIRPASLSPRETEVFEMMGHGCSRRDIAERLSVAAKTVDAHRAQIKRKLRVESMPELARRAVLWVAEQ